MKKTNVDFLFLIEHEDREGETVRRLCKGLRGLGYSCSILSIAFHAHKFRLYFPKVLIFPFAISQDTWPLCYFMTARYDRTQLVSLSWEQYLSKANLRFKKPRGFVVKEDMYHLSWTPEYKDFLEVSGVSPDNIQTLGSPNTALLNEQLAGLSVIEKRKELGITDQEVWFFPMNYGWAFINDRQINKKIKSGYDPQMAFEYREYSQKCLREFVKFIENLAITQPHLLLVIRPHPSVAEENYKSAFKACEIEIPKNCIITKKHTVMDWIAVSNVVASSWSTVVWDSFKIGKKVFLFTPYQRPDWMNTFWNEMVPNIACVSDLSSIKEKKTSVAPTATFFEALSKWLIEVHTNRRNGGVIRSANINFLKKKAYIYRALFFEISMKYLLGALVPKGIKRDYFDSNL